MKKILSLLLALAMLLGVCTVSMAEETADKSLEAIQEKGSLIMGLDDSFPPMGYRDDKNEIVGFDVDLARLVCAKLGVELVLQPISWDAKDLELSSGNIDCIWNGMSITPERLESMAISEPYLNNAIVLLVNNKDYQSKEDLAGKVIAVQNASTAEDVLNSEAYAEYKATLKEVVGYKDYLTAVMDLQNGGVDAVLIDLVVAIEKIDALGDDSMFVIDNLAEDLYGVGFRKGDQALCDAVNAAMEELAADGTMKTLSEQWFLGSDYTIVGKEATAE